MKLQLVASAALALLSATPGVFSEKPSSAIAKPIKSFETILDAVKAADEGFKAEDGQVSKSDPSTGDSDPASKDFEDEDGYDDDFDEDDDEDVDEDYDYDGEDDEDYDRGSNVALEQIPKLIGAASPTTNRGVDKTDVIAEDHPLTSTWETREVFYANAINAMKQLGASRFLAVGATSAMVDAGSADWSTLPWDVLESQLSSEATFTLSSPFASKANYTLECYNEMFRLRNRQPPKGEPRIANDLSDQPSGLCMNQLACAFEQCSPLDPDTTTIDERIDTLTNGLESIPTVDLPYNQTQWDEYLIGDNAFLNLPSTVLFPAKAKDVVAAINFAKDHGLEISVKTSGNSYSGASTKKGTLHLNMNKKFSRYSTSGDTGHGGVTDCDDVEDVSPSADFQPDLSDQPCRLAKARDVYGVVHVGGGEQFWESYQAVTLFNADYKEQTGNPSKFTMEGGGAGTVGPMGWSFQGGLGSTTGGRKIGIGVDQVVQIEMVLPTGRHVRFGPTEWDDSALMSNGGEFLVPKTTAVSGVCNSNPEEEDESLWEWEECDEDIPFDDLWFAMRGGLGGSWGVVLSLTIQLHKWEPMYAIEADTTRPDMCSNNDVYIGLRNVFVITFLLNPSNLTYPVTEEESKKCQGFRGDNIFCYGKGSDGKPATDPFLKAWEEHVTDEGHPELVDCIVYNTPGNLTQFKAYPDSDDPDDEKAWEDYASYGKKPYAGKKNDGLVLSFPLPSYMSTNENKINMLVPAKYFIDNPEAANDYPPSYLAFGGNVAKMSDQRNSLSEAHRLAGQMAGTPLSRFDTIDFWSKTFPVMFDTSDPENFPGFVGSNHAGPNTKGPLRCDWKKPCPLDKTTEWRDKNCISVQEAIYGTKRLKELERIKMEIDPNFMFDCYNCVLNNRNVIPTPCAPNVNKATAAEEQPNSGQTMATVVSVLALVPIMIMHWFEL